MGAQERFVAPNSIVEATYREELGKAMRELSGTMPAEDAQIQAAEYADSQTAPVLRELDVYDDWLSHQDPTTWGM